MGAPGLEVELDARSDRPFVWLMFARLALALVSLGIAIGLGGRRLCLTYVDNVVEALILAGTSDTASGKVFHIVDPDQPTVREYISAYQRTNGVRLRVLYVPTFLVTWGVALPSALRRLLLRPSPNLRYRLLSICRGPWHDTTAAREDLGWEAEVSFKDGLERTYRLG